MTIADEPALTSSDLNDDNFDATSKPAYFKLCTLTGLFGGFGLDSFHISSTRFELYKYTSSWLFLEITPLSSSAASEVKRNCLLNNMEENIVSGTETKKGRQTQKKNNL